ncbi:MAG: Do family serine endopeptidase [Rhodospirillales bacterium]|nr:Do family serine endopeptidase [Rhodospirillales bacterium]
MAGRMAAAAVLVAVFIAVTAGAAEKQVPPSRDAVTMSFAPLVKKAAPAVVNIYARKIVRQRGSIPLFDDPFFRRFFGEEFGLGVPRPQLQNSLGSGVIVRANGLIVTNKHVIEGADQINVVLADRREFAAKIVVFDDRTDLAVLQMDAVDAPLPVLELGDSDDIEVGDLVLAIGNPFGVGQTVTGGIVSALARTRVTPSDLNFFIQTDAAINPGNSGGALVTMNGKLIGVNTAIYSKSGGSLGIGFAIPSNMVRAVITGITKDGKLVRPWLGATGQGVTQDIATSLGLKRPTGVLISHVYKGAAADVAGLRVGDVVLAVNGHEVDDPKALQFRIATLPIGDTVALRVWRHGGTAALKLVLAPAPENPPRSVTGLDGRHPLAGATVANMSPALAEELGLDPFAKGVIILDLHRGSPASRLGFRAGDMVRAVNGADVATVAELKTALERRADRWQVNIDRGGEAMKLIING